jgi:hypothetical protein|nr:MAG TPA: hypothetical protein [Caudoviricetes sp.]
MDLKTLAAAKRYTDEKFGKESAYEVIEKIPVTEKVQNIRRIELIPAEDTSSGNAEIRIYGIKEKDDQE